MNISLQHSLCYGHLALWLTLAQRSKSTESSFQASEESVPEEIFLWSFSATALTSLKERKGMLN